MEGSSKKKTTRRRAENHAGKRPGRDLAMAKRGFEDVAAADTAEDDAVAKEVSDAPL